MLVSKLDLEQLDKDLKGSFDLSSERERRVQNFQMETKYIHFGMNGKRFGTETYLLRLQYIPKASPAEDQYTTSELQLRINDDPPVIIPELSNWSYVFNPTLSGADDRGPFWGISQDKFTSLHDNLGNALPFSIRYAVYTNFIDFHSFNDIFTKPMKFGKGIQDLKEIGQRVVHPASFIEASVKFGSEIKAGSIFQNGEVSLELKGVGLVDGAVCALISYDAGESKLKMLMPDSMGNDTVTEGGDQYKGDINVDLATLWVRKATLDEYMTSETTAQGSTSKVNDYTVRHIALLLIN